MEKTLILQCPGMVCSPPVVSKCLGETHRRLELFTLINYIIYITLNPFFFFFFFHHTVGNLPNGPKVVGRYGQPYACTEGGFFERTDPPFLNQHKVVLKHKQQQSDKCCSKKDMHLFKDT